MHRRHGFTLVELLIVVAIIGVLVSLLLPVILRSRQYALQLTCQANLQTMGAAYHAYAQDYKGGIVPLIRGSSRWAGVDWYQILEPYGKAEMARESFGAVDNLWIQCPAWRSSYNAYAQNGSLGFKDFLGAFRPFPTKFSQIPGNGSTTVLMGEDHTMSIGWKVLSSGFGKNPTTAHYRFAPTPHFGTYYSGDRWIHGTANVLFCDGHAEPIKWDNNWLKYENVNPF